MIFERLMVLVIRGNVADAYAQMFGENSAHKLKYTAVFKITTFSRLLGSDGRKLLYRYLFSNNAWCNLRYFFNYLFNDRHNLQPFLRATLKY